MDRCHCEYPYGAAWKAVVDRCGEEWRAYCQALSCVRRFVRTEGRLGRDAAVREWRDHLAAIEFLHGPANTARLKADFALVGRHESDEVRGTLTESRAERPDALAGAPASATSREFQWRLPVCP